VDAWSVGEPPDHRRDSVGERERLLAVLRVEFAPGRGDSDGRPDLVEAARGDAPVIEARSTESLAALREIQDERTSGPPDLIEERGIAASNDGERLPEGSNQLGGERLRMPLRMRLR